MSTGVASPPTVPLADEQRSVVAFETDLVVTAGAGSGKTRTLVELYNEVLQDPSIAGIEPEGFGPANILCLTFTERAAREITARVREKVDRPDWLRDLETAPISTFHAFCARILGEHPIEAGVDPRFTVLTEDAADDLLRLAIAEYLRTQVQSDRAAEIGVRLLGFNAVVDHLGEVIKAVRTAGWQPREPIKRFESRIEELTTELDGPLALAASGVAVHLLDAARKARLTQTGRRYLRDLETALETWKQEPSLQTTQELVGITSKAGRSWRFEGATPQRHELIHALECYSEVRTEVDHQLQLGVWPALVVSARKAYREARASRGCLDYEDLLLRARSLLQNRPAIRRSYRSRYRLVLVDEHQDTDPVQHEILSLLVGEEALAGRPDPEAPRWMVVGDAQQSIYGFRGATVGAFIELARVADGRGGKRTLAYNYRSRCELIDFHNAFFPRVLTGDENRGGITYAPQREFRGTEGRGAVDFLESESSLPAVQAREIEARAIAARIRAVVDPDGENSVCVSDKDGARRPATAGDVVVLLRRLTDVDAYRRALQAVGLQAVVIGSGGFYRRQEVFDCVQAVEAALRPEDPIVLMSFLRSPMVGVSDDMLYRAMRDWNYRSGISLLDHLSADETDISGRLARGIELRSELARRADSETAVSTLTWLFDRTGYEAVLAALPDATQRRRNLERLISLADRAPSSDTTLLSDWIAALRQYMVRPPRDRDAALPEVGDQVRLMSIHQAKGAEFPVVVLADLGGYGQSRMGTVDFDPELGVVAKAWDEEALDWVPTRSRNIAKENKRVRDASEEARLFYVAATRARDHLILSSGSGAHWWLKSVLEFVETADGGALVERSSLRDWSERFALVASEIPALPGPGSPYLDRQGAAPGEVDGRTLAAKRAGVTESTAPFGAARDSGRAAIRRGALGHEALERIPIVAGPDFDLRGWLSDVVGLSADSLAPLERFIVDRFWPVLGPARTVLREEPFRLHLPDGGGVVSGTIDCLWEDDHGNWQVWDYKFGKPGPTTTQHEAQLQIYALAAAASLGLEGVRGSLWYIDDDESADFDWTADDLVSLEKELPGLFERLDCRDRPAEDAPTEEQLALDF